jgi:2'-hydroxyisoflavone reductase
LDGGRWDAVFDTWSGDAAAVERAAQVLNGRAGHYVYVSTISVYANLWCPGQHEDSALLPASGDAPDSTAGRYRLDKVGSEAALRRLAPCDLSILRPGVIVGPYDDLDRLTKWLQRFDGSEPVAVPLARHQPLQLIDVRDLCGWALQLVERREAGTFNAVGPALTFGDFIDECRRATGFTGELDWIDEETLVRRGLDHWTPFPFWVPHHDVSHRGFFGVDNRKAVRHGLTFRPLAETIRDVLVWWRQSRVGAEREDGVLTAIPS